MMAVPLATARRHGGPLLAKAPLAETTMRSHRLLGLPLPSFAIPLCLLGGCVGQVGEESGEPPVVLGLSRTQVSVGEQLEIVGGGFLFGTQGTTDVRLDGEYHTKNGPTYGPF